MHFWSPAGCTHVLHRFAVLAVLIIAPWMREPPRKALLQVGDSSFPAEAHNLPRLDHAMAINENKASHLQDTAR